MNRCTLLVKLFLIVLFLGGCTKFGVIDSSLKSPKDSDSGDSGSSKNSIDLSSFSVNNVSDTNLQLSFDFDGDDNNDSNIKVYLCSLKLAQGCDPLSGDFATLTKQGSKVEVDIDLSTTEVTPGDVLKYKIVASDSDGITGGDKIGEIVVPHSNSPRLVTQLGFLEFQSDGSKNDYITSLDSDSSGNVYVCGYTSGTLAGPRGGGVDLFVAKLTSTGVLDSSFGQNGIVQLGLSQLDKSKVEDDDYCSAVKVDSSDGSVFVAGETGSNMGETRGDNIDAFVIKLTKTGELDTSFSTDGIVQLGNVTMSGASNNDDHVLDMALDSSGNIIVGGYTLGSLGEVNAGGYDAYIFRLTPSGALDTSFAGGSGVIQLGNVTIGAGASGHDKLLSLTVDTSGNIFATGVTFGNLDEVNAGGEDVFVFKLTNTGVLDTSFATNGVLHFGSTTMAAATLDEEGNGIEVDSSGNIYVSGHTASDLGETNAGGDDIFVAKILSTGVLDTSFSGNGVAQMGSVTVTSSAVSSEKSRDLKIDSSGNIYVLGDTYSHLGETLLPGYRDAFVAKLTSTGVLDATYSDEGVAQLGSVTIGATSNRDEFPREMYLNSDGSVYFTGETHGDFDELNAGAKDVFVAKLNSVGGLDTSFATTGVIQFGLSTLGYGTSGDDYFFGVQVDSSGNVYLAGYTEGSLADQNGGGGYKDIIVAKYNSNGKLDSTFGNNGLVQIGDTTIGGASAAFDETVTDLKIDGSGNIFIAGYTGSSLGEASSGGTDAFVVKLTSTGALDTSFSSDGIAQLGNVTIGAGASGNETVSRMQLDGSGNIFIVGNTRGALDETNAGGDDIFIAKLTSTGALDTGFATTGVLQLGNTTMGAAANADDVATDIELDNSGNIYVIGHTAGALDETNAGNDDVFILKLTSAGAFDNTFATNGILQLGNTTVGAGASASDSAYGLAVDGATGVSYIGGYTRGALDEANAGFTDIFVAKITSAGALDTGFSTNGIMQLGNVTIGGGASSYDYLKDITFDTAGDLFIVGDVGGSIGEANGGGQDAFIAKILNTGSFDTSFSGDGILQFGQVTMPDFRVDNNDYLNAVYVDSSGIVYAAGNTDSSMDGYNSGDYDAFYIRLDPADY